MFKKLQSISSQLLLSESDARNELIKFLWETEQGTPDFLAYQPLINHLMRLVGLFAYMNDSAHWEDRLVRNSFGVDSGDGGIVVLHREQSSILKLLLEGESILLSAPTSFWKSFIIDTYIAIRQPENVMVIVPTLALADEMRRRLYKRFAEKYEIITVPNQKMGERNIFIFPQERALGYVKKIKKLDILVVDEFYKVSKSNDKERSDSLQKIIIKLSKKSSQKYFLAPNIGSIKESPLIEWMKVIDKMGFWTVFLETHDMTSQPIPKEDVLENILKWPVLNEKSLIYAGTYSEISKLQVLVLDRFEINHDSAILKKFADWIRENYSSSWVLSSLVERGFWIHNWRLHRSIGQIEIRLFEEEDGLQNLISTSSIIEGVNTSAKNVILWKAKNGNKNLSEFTYKNIIGRGGRMFKYFIGKIYLLDVPPKKDHSTELDTSISDAVFMSESDQDNGIAIDADRRNKIIEMRLEMEELLWPGIYQKILRDDWLQVCSLEDIKRVVASMKDRPESWNGLWHLHASESEKWERFLRSVYFLMPWNREGIRIEQLLIFISEVHSGWQVPLSCTLQNLQEIGRAHVWTPVTL